jgi:opacity protein-like surface antigen
MKKRTLCGLAVAISAAGSQAAESGTYMKLDVGANYTGEIRQEFLNLPLERDLDMNIGVRASVAEGFLINRFLAIEVESGLLWNELDESVDWLMQIPILANVVLRYECKGGWTAFAGIGGGGAVLIANSTGLPDDDSDATMVPAWQGMAGLSYSLSPNMSVGLVYKYMGMTDPEFDLTALGMNQEFRLEKIQNHYGGLQLTYSF